MQPLQCIVFLIGDSADPQEVLAFDARTWSRSAGVDVFAQLVGFSGSSFHLNNAPWLSNLSRPLKRGGSCPVFDVLDLSRYGRFDPARSIHGGHQALFIACREVAARNGRPVPPHLLASASQRAQAMAAAAPPQCCSSLTRDIQAFEPQKKAPLPFAPVFPSPVFFPYGEFWNHYSMKLAAEAEALSISSSMRTPSLDSSLAARALRRI